MKKRKKENIFRVYVLEVFDQKGKRVAEVNLIVKGCLASAQPHRVEQMLLFREILKEGK